MSEFGRREDTAMNVLDSSSSLTHSNLNGNEKTQQYVETTGLSIDGKTIFSSSSGPTSPEEGGSPRMKTCDSPSTQSPLGFHLDLEKKPLPHHASMDSMNSSGGSLTAGFVNTPSLMSAFQQVTAKHGNPIPAPIDQWREFTNRLIQQTSEAGQPSSMIPSPEALTHLLKSKKRSELAQPSKCESNPSDLFPLKKIPKFSNGAGQDLKSLSPNRNDSNHESSKGPQQTSIPKNAGNLLMDNIESWRQFQQAAYAHNLDPHVLAMYQNTNFPGTGSNQARRKNATRETTSMLKAWLNEHRKNPYPTKGEKIMLAIITKMSLTQVSTWFANARRRLKKENKVTWAIRTCPNDGGDELDSLVDGDDDDVAMDDLDQLSDAKSDCKKRPKSPLNDDQLSLSSKSKQQKRSEDKKIWSLVEMTKNETNNHVGDLNSPGKMNNRSDQLTSTPRRMFSSTEEHLSKPDIPAWIDSASMGQKQDSCTPQSGLLAPHPSAFFSPDFSRHSQISSNSGENVQPNLSDPSQFSMSSLLMAASAMNGMLGGSGMSEQLEAMIKQTLGNNNPMECRPPLFHGFKTNMGLGQNDFMSAFKNPIGISKPSENI